jgi:uncharacterized BrkB/YihY/UPF0761 family membrane protein
VNGIPSGATPARVESSGGAAPDATPEHVTADCPDVVTEPEGTTVGTDAEATAIDSSGLRALVERNRQRIAEGQALLSDLIDEHHDRPLLDVGLRIYQRDREAAGTIVGSALAFRLFLFFVPLTLCVVGLFGFLARWIDPDDINDAAGLTGSIAAQVEVALTQPNSTRWIATLAGLFGMAWAGRTMSRVMVAASCLAWQLPITAKASVRLIGSVVGLLVGMVLVWTIVNRVRVDLGLGVASLSFVAAFAIYGVAWMAMSTLLPRATKDPSALLPGAVLVGAVLAGMQAIAQLYLPERLERASALYGALATTVVTLGWFFILGRAVVLAMSLNAVIHERFGSISRFVFSLPLVRILPRKSSWIRKFFDLEERSLERLPRHHNTDNGGS